MVDHIENVGNIDPDDNIDIVDEVFENAEINFENVGNIDPDDNIDIVDEVFENAEINFEDILDEEEEEESDEESLMPDDSGCDSDISEDNEDFAFRVVPHAEVNALNFLTKHCRIEFYYYSIEIAQPGICATCMINITNHELGIVRAYWRHETDSLERLRGRHCSNCRNPLFMYVPANMCRVCVQF
jgi:hypothetical protein